MRALAVDEWKRGLDGRSDVGTTGIATVRPLAKRCWIWLARRHETGTACGRGVVGAVVAMADRARRRVGLVRARKSLRLL